MNGRTLVVVILNVLGVMIPGIVLLMVFGAETKVDPNSGEHLVAIVGSGLFAFLVGSFSSWLGRRNQLLDMIDRLLR